MRGVKQVARTMVLVTAALWFALSVGTVGATEQTSHEAAGAAQPVAVQQGHGDAAAGHAEAAAAEPAGHGEAAAGAHGAVKRNSLSPEKLKDLGWRVINFIALMIILVKFGAKPIGAGLAARQKRIKDDIEDLEAKTQPKRRNRIAILRPNWQRLKRISIKLLRRLSPRPSWKR